MALKTTAAAPMSVIERVFHRLVVPANNNPDRPQFLKLKIEIYFGVQETTEKMSPIQPGRCLVQCGIHIRT